MITIGSGENRCPPPDYFICFFKRSNNSSTASVIMILLLQSSLMANYLLLALSPALLIGQLAALLGANGIIHVEVLFALVLR